MGRFFLQINYETLDIVQRGGRGSGLVQTFLGKKKEIVCTLIIFVITRASKSVVAYLKVYVGGGRGKGGSANPH